MRWCRELFPLRKIKVTARREISSRGMMCHSSSAGHDSLRQEKGGGSLDFGAPVRRASEKGGGGLPLEGPLYVG